VARLQRKVAVVGAAYSQIGRNQDLDIGVLLLQAARAALADAGLSPKDVDGISEYSYGEGSPQTYFLAKGLGVPSMKWWADVTTAPSGLGAALEGAIAIGAGAAETVVAFRCLPQRAGHVGKRAGKEATGGQERRDVYVPIQPAGQNDTHFLEPYGHFGIQQREALKMRRHMHEFGTKPEAFGQIAINQREFASLNERAMLRKPLTMEDYLNSRFISEPLRMFDCDYPVDAACAVVMTTAERARDCAKTPVFIDSFSFGSGNTEHNLQEDYATMAPADDAAKQMWATTELKPSDVDVAELYDGYTMLVLQWIEALGFCKRGEGGPFVEAGNTRLGGKLPVNTHGGMLSEGRVHGISHLAEAVFQLRGECGERQTPNAKVAAVSNGFIPNSGCMLVVRE
jgi:acetyl-CoA acetyltransferase